MIRRKRKKGANASRYATYRYLVDKISDINKAELGPRPSGSTLNHIIPIRKAFLMGLTEFETGSVVNLEWVNYQKNLQQGSRMTEDSIRVLRELGRSNLADVWEYKLRTRG